MPEGDTIHLLARRLGARLQGSQLVAVQLSGVALPTLAGRAIQRVEARGKHLLVWLDDDQALHLHLGLEGAVHRLAPGSAPRSGRRVSLLLDTAQDRVVGYDLRIAQAVRGRQLPRPLHPLLRPRLGPDLLSPRWSDPAWAERARAAIRGALEQRGARPVGELLLDQTVAAGLGNVYKCELLFLYGLHPWTPAERVPVEELLQLYLRGRDLLVANLDTPRRITLPQPLPEPPGPPGSPRRDPASVARHWVYGRAGRPCLRCDTLLQRRLQGVPARVTTWCPHCQPAPG